MKSSSQIVTTNKPTPNFLQAECPSRGDAAETWTLTHTDRRLQAFEMWIWRRMEKISWLDKVTNEEALRRVSKDNTELRLAKETSMDWPCFET